MGSDWNRTCPGLSGGAGGGSVTARRIRPAATAATCGDVRSSIPERRDRRAHRRSCKGAGGRPTGFNRDQYARRNEVERAVNVLKGFRDVGTRLDKRVYVFQGTVTLAAIRLWLRP